MIEQLRVGACAARTHGIAADKFVDVFEARVFARINDRASILCERHRGAFARHPPQRCALDGGGGGVHRVDLNDPAKPMGLVRVARCIKALVVFVPAQAEALGLEAITSLERVGRSRPMKKADEIFFAGQVGSPWGLAAGAIGQGADRVQALRVGSRLQQGVASGGARKAHRGAGCDAARIRRRPHHQPARGTARDLDDRHANRGLGLAHLLGAPGTRAITMQQPVVVVLVVDRQEGSALAWQGKELHAVVVHP